MTTCNEPTLLNFGSVGVVYQVTNDIAVKRAFADDNKGIHNEYRIYDMLDRMPYCPNLVRSFYRIPSANFLQYLSGGTIDQRLRQHQMRDPSTDRSLGYVHGDLRPPNLLLDSNDHLKVVDFDNTTKAGSVFDGCQPPYARVLGDEAAENRGTFGYHGPCTEQFAIGSIFYYMTRGYEPYDNEWFGEDHGEMVVSLFQEKKFPKVNVNGIDTIIHKCWHGEYEWVRNMKLEVIRLHRDLPLSMAKAMPKEEYEARHQEIFCQYQQHLIDHGICPRGHDYDDDEGSVYPDNWEEIDESLAQPQPSLSPSRFPREAFRKG
ncbi:MAG: hypothetical protein Q9163_005116 [Psora crenata]